MRTYHEALVAEQAFASCMIVGTSSWRSTLSPAQEARIVRTNVPKKYELGASYARKVSRWVISEIV
jgi:hypothetical protein